MVNSYDVSEEHSSFIFLECWTLWMQSLQFFTTTVNI